MLNRQEAESLIRAVKKLSIQEFLFMTEDFPGDYGTTDECMLEILDYWLDLWIEHDALLAKASEDITTIEVRWGDGEVERYIGKRVE